MTQGKFVTIEGGEGAGKTTLIALLVERLAKQGLDVLTTREPGGIPIAEAIRAVILDRSNTAMEARTEALLYAAARRQHLVEKVMPALDRGTIVICDRFVDSSLAYQGHARGLGIDQVWEINRFATQGCMPDLTLYLDLEPAAGLARIHANADRELNRLDLEELAFHELVRQGYQEAVRRSPDRIVTLDASVTPEQLAEAAWPYLMERLAI